MMKLFLADKTAKWTKSDMQSLKESQENNDARIYASLWNRVKRIQSDIAFGSNEILELDK